MGKLLFAIVLPILVLAAGLVVPGTNAAMLMVGPSQVDSNGVRVVFSPDPALPKISEATKLLFTILNITDPAGTRTVKHVDVVVAITLGGQPILEAVTHSHTGILTISKVFDAPGLYKIVFDVSSTPDSVNPAMGGTPGDDFGSRSAVFWIAVTGSPQSVTVNGVTIEFESSPTVVVQGSTSYLSFRIKNASTGEPVTHLDQSLTLSDGSRNILATNQMHGHMGILGVSAVFPHGGRYTLSVTVNTTPATVKDQFGTRSASFTVDVQSGASNSLLLILSYAVASLAGAGAAGLGFVYVPRLRHRSKIQ